jgi:DNA-binding NarL/FixJ family response regulator
VLQSVFEEEPRQGPSRPDRALSENPFTMLTPRELEVLHYQLKCWKTNAISEALNLKMNTVSTLKKRIYEKTRTENIRQLLDLVSLYKVNY